jgi:hypothetical protein
MIQTLACLTSIPTRVAQIDTAMFSSPHTGINQGLAL